MRLTVSLSLCLFGSYASAGSAPDSDAESEEGSSSSSASYDEGSYDGRAGQIVYTCQDDEAIAQGSPGAVMFDQNIRET